MRRVTTTVICDLPHATDQEARVSVKLTASSQTTAGKLVELDLCDECTNKFLAPLVEAARPISSNALRARDAVHLTAVKSSPNRRPAEHTAAVRRWALDNGYTISGRGRIPADVEAAFNRAHALSTNQRKDQPA